MAARAAIRDQVERFYDELPFNSSGAEAAVRRIAATDQLRGRPDLRALLMREPSASVLDLGCGAGWFPLTLAAYHGISSIAVDLSATALAARERRPPRSASPTASSSSMPTCLPLPMAARGVSTSSTASAFSTTPAMRPPAYALRRG